MKYIANGKRHQQEIGARRWRPCLIKTNCRWARIFFLTENRLKLPSETLLQQSESTRAHGGRWRGGYKNTSQETKDDCTRKKRTKKKNKKTHPSVCNSKAIIAHIVLIYLKVRGGQVVFWMLNISEVLQASNSILKLRPPPTPRSFKSSPKDVDDSSGCHIPHVTIPVPVHKSTANSHLFILASSQRQIAL